MNKLNYRAIPQKTIEAKAIRFVGNSYREAMLVARRKGAIGEPLLVISKTSISIVYYPSAELYEIAVEIHERAQAYQAAIKAERDRPTALTNVRNIMNAKMQKQGITFKRPDMF